MKKNKLNLSLIGCGNWGNNIARNCQNLNVLYSVTDTDKNKSKEFSYKYNCKNLDINEIVSDEKIDGVIISTPGKTHFKIAQKIIKSKKHVFIEKPMTINLSDALELEKLAKRVNVQIMIGHLIRYHPGFIKLLEILKSGSIGKIRHITANRVAFGRILKDESVIYDLYPHDLSLILEICNSIPKIINSTAICYINKAIADIANTILHFKENITVSMNASWINPKKEHKFVVIGTLGSIVFDDTNPWKEKVLLYRDIIQNENNEIKTFREKVEKIKLLEKEPLEEELLHFMKVCKSGATPLTNAKEGVKVQRVLDKIIKKTVIVN